MKVIIFFFLLLLAANTNAQNCKDFLFFKNNKTIEMAVLKANGKPDGKVVYKVTDVQVSGNNYSSTVNNEVISEKGKSRSKSQAFIKCTGTGYAIDFRSFMPLENQPEGLEVDVNNAQLYLNYPASMNTGDVLEDGNFKCDAYTGKNKELKTTITVDISDRNIVGQESITTPAGTWNCYKITSKQRLKISIGGFGIPININMTEWFASGVGIIKTASKFGSTVISSIE